MSDTECVESIMIDICKKTFVLHSDLGNTKEVVCDNADEFMGVLELVNSSLTPDQIKYSNFSVYENTNS